MPAKKSTTRPAAQRPAPQRIEHGSLSCALAGAQSEIKNPPLDKQNPHFGSRYSTLSALLTVVREALPKHGLSFTQTPALMPLGEVHQLVLVTTITHGPSKESVQGTYPIDPTKRDPQGFGSALTYARRYSLSSMVGVVGEEDDDGNHGSSGQAPRSSSDTDAGRKQQATSAPKPFRNKREADCVAGEGSDCLERVPVGHGWTKKDDSHPQGWATICDPCVAFRKSEAAQAEEELSQDPEDAKGCAACGSSNLNALGVCEDCGADNEDPREQA